MVTDNRLTSPLYDAALLSDCMTAEGVSSPVFLYSELASTNLTAKEAAKNGAAQGTAVIAEMQSAGRGRLGKTFYSPPGNGIYLSLVLRPDCSEDSILRLTTAVSVAVCLAVERICALQTEIKWVNDIYLYGKKLCGILCEGVIGPKGKIDAVVCGIGVNYRSKDGDFPEELKATACSLYENREPSVSREALAAALIRETVSCVDTLKTGSYLAEYKRRSYLLGRNVVLFNKVCPESDEPVSCTAVDIDDLGGLVVRFADGSIKALHTGEVSVRLD